MGKSSKDESESSGASAAAVSRPVFISYATADTPLAQKVCAAHGNTSSVVPVADKSIAVLPFVDLSENKNPEYFADSDDHLGQDAAVR